MRIHSDSLTYQDFVEACPAGVEIDTERYGKHGSRKRAQAFEISLAVEDGGEGTAHPYRRNSGQYGANQYLYAATYDEWGWWLAELFHRDPEMIAGPYKGIDDFHAQTSDAYRSSSPGLCVLYQVKGAGR